MTPVVSRYAVLGLVGALAVAVVAGQAAAGRPWIGVALAVPLLFPLPGLAQGVRDTYAWSTLLISVYIGLGLVETVASPAQRGWAAGTVFCAFLAFVGLVVHLRVSRPATAAESVQSGDST